ncbi:MAG: response regulator [Planctomycetota bacterium]
MIGKPNLATKLLLVDDDPSIVRLLTTVIDQEFGGEIEITCLTDSQDALAWIQEQVVDILVTDLEMPGVSGLELLRTAKRRNVSTQVVFITGYSTLDALVEALESGANDYLPKPIDPSELVDLVRSAQERHRRWQAALADTRCAGRAT